MILFWIWVFSQTRISCSGRVGGKIFFLIKNLYQATGLKNKCMDFKTRKLTCKKKSFAKYPLGLVFPSNIYRFFLIQSAFCKTNLKINMYVCACITTTNILNYWKIAIRNRHQFFSWVFRSMHQFVTGWVSMRNI